MTSSKRISLFIFLSLLIPSLSFAARYYPGQTLTPDCGPTDTDCTVSSPLYSSASSNNLGTAPQAGYFTATSTTATSTFAGPTSGLRGTDLMSSTTERADYGRYNLNDFEGSIGMVQNSVMSNTVIAYIGDSWVAGNNIVDPIYNYINTNFPFAGVGYVPVDSYAFNVPLAGATRISAGTWTDITMTGLGPNLSQTNSSDIATPASKGVTCVGTDFTIYYLKQSGGGSFGYNVDAGSSITISTSNASSDLGVVNITGQTFSSHTITMTVNAAGTSGVTLFGVDCGVNNSRGIKIHKLGMSGSEAGNWADIDANIFQREIAQLNPSLVIITLGTNDIRWRSVNTYINNIKTIIANVRAASSTIDILLAPPTISAMSGSAGDVSAYFAPLQDLARQNGYGYVEVSKYLGPYATANTKGFWHDTAHMSVSGYQVFANTLIDYLGLISARNKSQGDIANSVLSSYFGKGSGINAYSVTGTYNLMLGIDSGSSLTSASYNTAIGYGALNAITSGNDNTAVGSRSLMFNTGYENSGNGTNSMYSNTTGNYNTANGSYSFYANVGGSENVALGYKAGRYQADGSTALTSANQSVYIGSRVVGYSNSDVNSIVIGYSAQGIGANSVVLGNDDISRTVLKGKVGMGTTTPWAKLSISALSSNTSPLFTISTSTASATSTAFLIDSRGQVGLASSSPWRTLDVNGTVGFKGLTSSAVGNALCITGNNEVTTASVAACSGVSSKRFKHDILDTDLGLSTILNLHPITFKYNQGYGDSGKDQQFGLIAEEVQKIDPRLIILDSGGLPTAVRYDFLPTILVKAVQELSAKVDNLISNGLAIIKNVVADSITAAVGKFTEKLCVGQTCVTETELKSLLQNANISAVPMDIGTAPTSPSTNYELKTTNSPTITLLGNNPATIDLHSTYIDPGATALDSNGVSLMPDIASSSVNTSIAGTYQVIWTVHDSAMNFATTTRSVIVIDHANATTTATTTPAE